MKSFSKKKVKQKEEVAVNDVVLANAHQQELHVLRETRSVEDLKMKAIASRLRVMKARQDRHQRHYQSN